MPISLRATLSRAVRSLDAGRELGRGAVEVSPRAILVFASVEHDQQALLAGLREVVGADVALIGCSTQGVMGREVTIEGGYFAAACAFGGDVQVGVTRAESVQHGAREQGRALATRLREQVPTPKLAMLFFDPFAGVDVAELLSGFDEVLHVPVVGGAASQPWGSMVRTYQYFGDTVFNEGAVALALDGPFAVEVAASHGTEPVGLEYVATRVEGTQLIELEGRRAADVWKEALAVQSTDLSQMAALALGLANDGQSAPELGAYRVLAPTRFNDQTGGFFVLTAIPAGSTLALHYRTVESVLEGTRRMARELKARVGARKVVGALGFECGARTEPFLGRDATTAENVELQRIVAPDAVWLGMMAWGEILPLRSGPTVVNYTFPVVCLVES